MYIKSLQINKNYIIWSLISIPILVGIFLIVRQFIFFGVGQVTGTEKGVRYLFFQEKVPDTFFTPKSLASPPDIVKGIYFTSTSSGNDKKIDYLIDLAKTSELNTVVIDIKDSSGYISYDSAVPEAEKYKTELVEIKDIDSLIKKLHENSIYVIARMTVFQDPILARARPDWAVKNKLTGRTWYNHKKLAWIDPANREAWQYFAALAKDIVRRGADEINFDYIRFPSDGNLDTMVFPAWLASPKPSGDRVSPEALAVAQGGDKTMTRPQVLKEFFKYMRGELGDARMSADLFGFVTTRTDDFGVGQILEDAFEYFDYICPMVYPSHYPPTYLGFQNSAAHPYEVVYASMKGGMERLKAYKEKNPNNKTEFRPWLQDFSLGADYTEAMVRAEIKATQNALGDHYKGFMLWNARNVYHKGVFGKK